MGLSMSEILVIAVVVLLLFGAKKIPELARALGRATYEFKKAKQDLMKETEELTAAAEKNAAAAATAEQQNATAAATAEQQNATAAAPAAAPAAQPADAASSDKAQA